MFFCFTFSIYKSFCFMWICLSFFWICREYSICSSFSDRSNRFVQFFLGLFFCLTDKRCCSSSKAGDVDGVCSAVSLRRRRRRWLAQKLRSQAPESGKTGARNGLLRFSFIVIYVKKLSIMGSL